MPPRVAKPGGNDTPVINENRGSGTVIRGRSQFHY